MGGFNEDCQMDDILWPSESIYVSNLYTHEEKVSSPTFAGLQSLTLNCCCGLEIHPEGGAKGLRDLEIVNHDAITIFSYFCKMNPEVAQTLDSLRLASMINDFFLPEEFLSSLE